LQPVIDIEEGESPDPRQPESGAQDWFDLSVTSDYDEAQTLHMLIAAYMDVAEDFFAKYTRDPGFSPPAFAAMHRRIHTLISEIRTEQTTILDDDDEPRARR